MLEESLDFYQISNKFIVKKKKRDQLNDLFFCIYK